MSWRCRKCRIFVVQLLWLSVAKNQSVDFLIGPKLGLKKRDTVFMLPAQTERFYRIVIYMADITDSDKPRNILQRFFVPPYDSFFRHVMSAVMHTGLDASYIQIWITGKDEAATDKIAALFCPLQQV